MPFKTEPITGPVNPPKYEYQRYPINLHRGEYPAHQTRQAFNEEEEAQAIEAGWSLQAPTLPDPVAEFVAAVTLEERVNRLQATVDELVDAVSELKTPRFKQAKK